MSALKTFANLPVAENVPIPFNVLVPCPKTPEGTQNYRYAAQNCPACEFFSGIAKRYNGEPETDQEIEVFNSVPWSQKYAIRCSTIMEIPCSDIDTREY